MRQVLITSEVATACELLFGRSRPVIIDRATLARRYRDRAFVLHPDRAASLGRPADELSEAFLSLTQAHTLLISLFEGASRISLMEGPPAAPVVSPGAGRARRSTAKRPPSFTEFLYYSGRITFSQLLEIQTWQRRHRPQVGRIAMEWGMLSSNDVSALLRRRDRGDRFCDAAVQCGLMTRPQRLAVLGRQRQLERCVDDFLLSRGLMGTDELAALRQRAHAAQVPDCR
ncbi:MAG: hypothetical protein JRH20_18870 [Deltaproteobacteria bacterium]|nr:hypothetical protein [Deltaproteobacteria bacterium]